VFTSGDLMMKLAPPTSMYAAYNLISAPKTLNLALETGHWTYPEQNTKMQNWLIEVLTKK